jgi:hypothetical protein
MGIGIDIHVKGVAVPAMGHPDLGGAAGDLMRFVPHILWIWG